MPVAPTWTEEERDRVADLIVQEKSTRDIADDMGLNRNQVIGRIHRDKILAKLMGDHHHPALKKRKPVKPLAPPLKLNAQVADIAAAFIAHFAKKDPPPKPSPPRPGKPEMRLIPLMNLRANQCRWPQIEDWSVTGGYLFCGADTSFGEPYCDYHAALARPERRG